MAASRTDRLERPQPVRQRLGGPAPGGGRAQVEAQRQAARQGDGGERRPAPAPPSSP